MDDQHKVITFQENGPSYLQTESKEKISETPANHQESARMDSEQNEILKNSKNEYKDEENNKNNEKIDSKTEEIEKEEIHCLDKACGQKEPGGSISGAIFAMTSLSIGTGCLTFTKRVISMGFIWFGVVLIFGGWATYWTIMGLIRSAKADNDNEFSSIIKRRLGKYPALAIDITTCLYSFGLIITYEIIMNSLIGRIIYTFFKSTEKYPTFDSYNDDEWNSLKIKAIVLVILNVVLTPLCLFKDIGKMKFFSLFGIIALGYTIFVLVIECPYFWSDYLENVYKKDDKSTHANWFDITKSFNKNLDFFTGFATIVFSFSCHQGVLPVYRTLKGNDEKTMQKIFTRSIILDLLIYYLIYISSFLTTPLESEDLIIYRKSIFSNDIFMNIAKIAIFFELFFLIPSNYNSFRCSLFHIIFGNENIKTIPNIILTICTLALCALIGALYSQISNYISMLGGICCTTYCFMIPGWLKVKNEWKSMSTIQKILSFSVVTLLYVLGYIGGIMSIILIFK